MLRITWRRSKGRRTYRINILLSYFHYSGYWLRQNLNKQFNDISHEHDDVIKWKLFSRYWPFVRGIHRSPVNSPHKGQWCGALVFSLICAWTNGRDAGDVRRHGAHYDVTVMIMEKFRRCVKALRPGHAYILCIGDLNQAPSHYLNQCLITDKWNFSNKLQWKFKRN